MRVGPFDYLVTVSDAIVDEDGQSMSGHINVSDGIIQVRRYENEHYMRMVLWHESLHAVLAHASRADEVSEEALDTIAHGIVQILRDNDIDKILGLSKRRRKK